MSCGLFISSLSGGRCKAKGCIEVVGYVVDGVLSFLYSDFRLGCTWKYGI